MRTTNYGLILTVFIAGAAHANPCANNTTGDCYYNTPTNSPSQGQQQAQGQAQQAQGGNAVAGAASASKSISGAAAGASSIAAQQQGTTVSNTSYTESRAAANTVGLGTQIIAGCGIAGEAGGSNSHGSAVLGIGFTTEECYAYIEAQALNAIGDRESACQVLHTTNAAKRAEKRLGHPLPACEPPAVTIVHDVEYRIPAGYVSEEEVQARITEALKAQPVPQCPKPAKRKGSAPKALQPAQPDFPSCLMTLPKK